MRLCQFALILFGLVASDALAAGPVWHRSATLDYRVADDGTSVATEIWEVRADTNSIAQTIAQQTFSFLADLEQVEIVAAFTRKRDGRMIPIGPHAVMDKAVTTVAAAPQFSALSARTIVFPQVVAGDTVHYELRRVTREAMFPGEFLLDTALGGGATTERAEIRVALPPGRRLKTVAAGLEELPAETRADSSVVRRWRRAADADGPIQLLGSTFEDYAAVGRAYAARAWPSARPGPAIRALAEQLAPVGLDDRETAQRLYRYVASEIRYVAAFFGKGRVVPRDAEIVLAEGWGDCKDHSALLQALLAAKGIETKPALISTRNRYDLPDAPGLSALDHVILYVPALDLFLDSTASYAPFGLLPAGEYDKPAVIADPQSARLDRTYAMPGALLSLATRTEAMVAQDGAVSGHTTTIAEGPQAIALRGMAAWFEARGATSAAIMQLQQLGTPGGGRYAFESPDEPDGPFAVEGWFTLDDPLPEAGAAPFPIPVGLTVFGRPGRQLLGAGRTEDGNHVCFPGRETEDIALELPSGTQLRDQPPDIDVSAAGARYLARYMVVDGTLHVRREFSLVIDHQRCRPAEYDAMLPVLAAARQDLQTRISLIAETRRQRVAAAP